MCSKDNTIYIDFDCNTTFLNLVCTGDFLELESECLPQIVEDQTSEVI